MTPTCDVVVVGAGILGAAAARTLAGRGLSVTVLESGRAGSQGSAATAGNVHIQGIHTRRPGQRVPVDVQRLVPLQAAAHGAWLRWEDEIPSGTGWHRTGGWMVAETAEDVAELHRKQRWEAAAGIPTEVVDGAAARRVTPALGPSVLAATWCDWDGWADPAVTTPALVADARRAGVEVLEQAPVAAVRPSGDGFLVQARGVERSCGVVVDVAGPWLGEICRMVGVEVALAPLAIQMYRSAPAPRQLDHLVQHVAQGLSVKQADDGRFLVGGGWPAGPLRPDGTADVDAAGVTASAAQASRVLPLLAAHGPERAWTGPLSATPDEMPVIGALPGHPGFLVAGGTYGFTFAPLWADVLAAAVTGIAPPVDVADLGPARLVAAADGPLHPAGASTVVGTIAGATDTDTGKR
ncbi:NAD(P)/FAD-dependent oxidoreductase [Nakamurella endophytica]|uniref:Oxidase n=1 Tax=Nakamurella endophytica TaxID=1748367 RepID=A0A917WMP9_9ACTN|nr:FAD-binding oxidoreductase [Nakamurella endophytica]GGM15526.1 oxidase [Nakamurella endophytica]